MSDFYIDDCEAALIANVLKEELEAIEGDREDMPGYVEFIEDLLDAVRKGDNIMRSPKAKPPQVGNVVHFNFGA